jgi:hypothetical protein
MSTTMTSPRLPKHCDAVSLVLDGLGTFGQADRETDPRHADQQTVLARLWSEQSEYPLRIVAFAEGWARDVTAEIAQEVLAVADQDLSPAVRDVVERAG